MGDILSQEEVDALLSAVSSEDEADTSSQEGPAEESQDDRPLTLYDFRRPDRVSKDQMRTLQNLHEGYARQFSTTLTNFLRTFVEIELVSVDQLTYSEFIMSISNPSCIYIFNMEPLEGSAILEVNPSLVFFIIDRLFGGQGTPSEEVRELTKIEENVIRRIIERSLTDLRTAWENIGVFNPKIETYETNPQFVQIAPPGETVILVSLEVKMQNASGLMSLCFPYVLLENVITKLSGGSWFTSQSVATEDTRDTIKSELMDRTIPVSVVVGNTKLKIRDFLQLRRGDLICLDKPADSDFIFRLRDRPKMKCKVGVSGRKKVARITEIIEKEVPGSNE
ncbi:MAG: flagellar motor switch protein FliM [Chitinivibrionales bacterium]